MSVEIWLQRLVDSAANNTEGASDLLQCAFAS